MINKIKSNILTAMTIVMAAIFFTCGNASAATPSSTDPISSMTRIEINTTAGPLVIALYNDTPLHRDNFIKLVNDGFYNGLLFHRVIRDFMVQTGDPDSRNAPKGKMLGAGNAGYEIDAEILCPTHINKRGALAAARTGDYVNPKRRSSGSQFYIVTGRTFTDAQLDRLEQQTGNHYSPEQRDIYRTIGGAPHLDGAYTVFGEVVSGLDTIEKIEKVDTDANDRPVDDVKIISMKLLD